MSSFVRLSLGAAVAFAVAACSSSNSTPPADAGTDTSVVRDTGVADTATPDTGTTDSGSCTLQADFSSDKTCNDCVAANCCEDLNTCVGDTKCTDINTCLSNCDSGKNPDASTFDAADQSDGGPSQQCAQACIQAGDPTGIAELRALVICVYGSSTTTSPCTTPCGG